MCLNKHLFMAVGSADKKYHIANPVLVCLTMSESQRIPRRYFITWSSYPETPFSSHNDFSKSIITLFCTSTQKTCRPGQRPLFGKNLSRNKPVMSSRTCLIYCPAAQELNCCQICESACSNGLYLYRPPVSFIIPEYRPPPACRSSTVTAREYGIFALSSILPLA